MEIWKWVLFLIAITLFGGIKIGAEQAHQTERISGSAGDVLEDDPVGRLKVFVY